MTPPATAQKKPAAESNPSAGMAGVDENGKAPKARISTATALHNIFIAFVEADEASAHNRRILQAAVDGEAPYKDAVMRATGQGWRFNLNFLEGDTQLQKTLMALFDLIESVDTLLRPKLPLDFLTPDERAEVEDGIAEEIDVMIREWPEFDSQFQILITHFAGFGVGFATHPDEDTWKFNAGGWDDYMLPRKTKATEEAVEVLIGRKTFPVHELWKLVEDEAHSPKWNIEEVQRALTLACNKKASTKTWQKFWPGVEESLRNNDIETSYATATEVECIIAWNREFSGKYSVSIGLMDGSNKELLYQDIGRYDSAIEAFTIFTAGVGNGTYHSIRGLLWKMFPFIQTSNRLRCGMLDATLLSMSLLLQAVDSDSMEDMALTIAGPVSYLPQEAQVVERGIPNVGNNALPVVSDLSEQFSNATGQYQPVTGSREQTAREYQGTQEARAALGTGMVNMFYRSWRRLLSTMFKRVQKIGPNNKKFPEVAAFYERCAMRGITVEMIKKVARVEPMRAIGHGSPQLRQFAFDELASMLPQLDETGRANALRDRIANRFGRAVADRYAPKVQRIAPEVKIAALENAMMKVSDVPVLPNESHAVHVSVHAPALFELIEALAQIIDAEEDILPMRSQIEYAARLHAHTSQHVAAMEMDPTRKDQVQGLTQGLQQATGILNSAINQLQAQEEEAAAGGGASTQAVSEMEHQQQLAHREQDHQQKVMHRQQDFQTKIEQRRLQGDIKLAEIVRRQTAARRPALPTLRRAA